MSDSTLRESALLFDRREMVGWEAGVRLGARAGVRGAEETRAASPPPPSPSPPEDDDGVRSKYAASSVSKQNTIGENENLVWRPQKT